jgi:hypothetical protein
VKIGELGGWVKSEQNLSHTGNAWVSGDARVFGDSARISGNARIIQNSDYTVFKNNLTSQRYYTYIFTNDFWVIGCFKGNTDELKKHLEKNGNELQKIEYNMAIEYVQKLKEIKEKMAVKR